MLQPHIQLSEEIGIKKAILVGDPARLDTLKGLLDNAEDIAYNREFRSIKGRYNGVEILGLSTGVGGPSATIAVEELAQIGVKEAIRVGSAGAYQPEIGLGDLIIATGVVRNDGISKEYIPVEFPATPDLNLLILAKKYAPFAYFGTIRSHDGFYMDSNEKTEQLWSDYGVLGADMESGPVMVVGHQRGLKTLSILNNVVLWGGDVKEGVNDLVNEGELVSQGEKASLKIALDILTDKE